jgi:hypothetical protein
VEIPVTLSELAGGNQRGDLLVVALQQPRVDFAKFDLLKFVGKLALQKLPVVGGCFTAKQFLPQWVRFPRFVSSEPVSLCCVHNTSVM